MKFRILAANFICAVMLLLGSGCKTNTVINDEYAFQQFEVTCLGVDPGGYQMLRSWGQGRSKADAIEQAKRRAVETVIFEGINSGTSECNKRPIVNQANARERYEEYFNAFFREGGAYNKYVTLNETRTSRIKAKNTTLESWSVVVLVNRTALRNRLADDNVISK